MNQYEYLADDLIRGKQRQEKRIEIDRVVDLLGLERNPKCHNPIQYTVRCPFCDAPGKYHMQINAVNNVYFCFKCMNAGEHSSGVLDLYSRVRNGIPVRKGRNGKQVFQQLIRELGEDRISVTPCKEKEWNVKPADDEALNQAYEALLNLSCMQLSEEHGYNLRKRGQNMDYAKISGYASGKAPVQLLKEHPAARQIMRIWEEEKLETQWRQSAALKRMPRANIQAGMILAAELEIQGISLERVPGFYELSPGIHAMKYEKGMYIPTRNLHGEIVGMQVRRDHVTGNELRYKTVSAGTLPGSVNTGISRVHFSGTEEKLGRYRQIWITEGPLKADTARCLLQRNGTDDVGIFAVPGVSNTRELPQIFRELKHRGVEVVFEFFDMDKLINPSVARAALALERIAEKEGIRLQHRFWDKDEIARICREIHKIHPKITGEITETRDGRKVTELMQWTSRQMNTDKEALLRAISWRAESKGIDDYLRCWLHV